MALFIEQETQVVVMWRWKKSEFHWHPMEFPWQLFEKSRCLRILILIHIRTLSSNLNANLFDHLAQMLMQIYFFERLLDVIHRRADRENQLELFLVFEYLERDLADYISHLPTTTMIPSHKIQVGMFCNLLFDFFSWTHFFAFVSGCFCIVSCVILKHWKKRRQKIWKYLEIHF